MWIELLEFIQLILTRSSKILFVFFRDLRISMYHIRNVFLLLLQD